MTMSKLRFSRRRGAAAVEAAFVLILTTSFIFGVLEYCRLLMDWNLLNNAAREGCRYALVNNTKSTIAADVQSTVTASMAGEQTSFSNFTVTVSGTHDGTVTAVSSLAPGDIIIVTVSGKYNFLNIVPIIAMPTTLTLTSSVKMLCEGGT